jgi:rubrerythrin
MANKDSKTRPIDLGSNRTGIATSPFDTAALEKSVAEGFPTSTGSSREAAQLRIAYSKDAGPVGTIPPPGTLKGMAATALEAMKGHKGAVLIDKLGERLAFERTGSRLYEALIAKFEAAHTEEGSLRLADLEELREDELRHFGIVRSALQQLGADPTAMTPCADIVGTASAGLLQVLADPRTTLTQALDTLLIAELADNDGWRLLISLAEGMGQGELAQQFATALAEEERHLVKVRGWVAERLGIQAGAPVEGESRPLP